MQRTKGLRLGAGFRFPRLAALALIALLGVTLLQLTGSDSKTATAKEILEKAQKANSAQRIGVISLYLKQESTTYALPLGHAAIPTITTTKSIWFQAPNLQRIETDSRRLAPDGRIEASDSQTYVWDGSNRWTFEREADVASRFVQDNRSDVYLQGVLLGLSPGDQGALYAVNCRNARTIGEDRIAGQPTYVIELGRARCGWVLPGLDGRSNIWVDKKTGLILKSEVYAADGRLYSVREVTAVEYDEPLDSQYFTFSPPTASTRILDRTSQPPAVGLLKPSAGPMPASIKTVREAATFAVVEPGTIPAGYKLESVEHYWPDDVSAELRAQKTVHADWILFRYADVDGNWLVITQGYGGYVPGLVLGAPATTTRGTVDIGGRSATWIDGNPTNGWRPGGMTSIIWATEPQGTTLERRGVEIVSGTSLYLGVASNSLSLQELIEVAESLH